MESVEQTCNNIDRRYGFTFLICLMSHLIGQFNSCNIEKDREHLRIAIERVLKSIEGFVGSLPETEKECSFTPDMVYNYVTRIAVYVSKHRDSEMSFFEDFDFVHEVVKINRRVKSLIRKTQ